MLTKWNDEISIPSDYRGWSTRIPIIGYYDGYNKGSKSLHKLTSQDPLWLIHESSQEHVFPVFFSLIESRSI